MSILLQKNKHDEDRLSQLELKPGTHHSLLVALLMIKGIYIYIAACVYVCIYTQWQQQLTILAQVVYIACVPLVGDVLYYNEDAPLWEADFLHCLWMTQCLTLLKCGAFLGKCPKELHL